MSNFLTLDDSSELKIGFPPPLLGPEPVRLPAATVGEGLLAIALPGGILSDANPFYPDRLSLVAGLKAQIAKGKPELVRLGMEIALSINLVEAEVSGVSLVGCTREAVAHWRNVYGSQQLKFSYEFVAQVAHGQEDSYLCDLPVARHSYEQRMLVSHKSGKKSETCFERIGECGDYALWRATTTLPRWHQVRLHAMECGLKIPGEGLYDEVPPLDWHGFAGKPSKLRGLVPTGQLPIHLSRIEAIEGVVFQAIETPPGGKLGQVWKEFAPK
ncbi:MAG: hypothetical protein AAFX93_14905 [Verrucomicrobiota bacterium]